MGAGRRAGQGPGIMPKNILTTLAPSVGVPHFYLLDLYSVCLFYGLFPGSRALSIENRLISIYIVHQLTHTV